MTGTTRVSTGEGGGRRVGGGSACWRPDAAGALRAHLPGALHTCRVWWAGQSCQLWEREGCRGRLTVSSRRRAPEAGWLLEWSCGDVCGLAVQRASRAEAAAWTVCAAGALCRRCLPCPLAAPRPPPLAGLPHAPPALRPCPAPHRDRCQALQIALQLPGRAHRDTRQQQLRAMWGPLGAAAPQYGAGNFE